jgi:hypothetical protein
MGDDVRQHLADLDDDIDRLERSIRASDRATPAQIVDERLVATRMAARRARLSELRAERATLAALLPKEDR